MQPARPDLEGVQLARLQEIGLVEVPAINMLQDVEDKLLFQERLQRSLRLGEGVRPGGVRGGHAAGQGQRPGQTAKEEVVFHFLFSRV